MATRGWGTDRSVEETLFSEGHRFNFYQAVKLLEILRPGAVSVGAGSEPKKEAVRFSSKVGIEFPATDIDEVRSSGGAGDPAEMTVNFMGLAGSLGPLPLPYTELILDRTWHRDTALKGFLDIFNHRLISLMYRVRKTHRIGFDHAPPDRTPFAGYLFSLIGMGTGGLLDRMRVRDRALLFYAGLLSQQPRSMTALDCLLSNYFQVRVRGIPFLGRWRILEEDQVTKIGISGCNQRLGRDVVLGTRVWDQQGGFEILIGPLGLDEFTNFLPIGDGFTPLCELTRFYAGTELDFEFRLTLRGEEVPESRLGGAGGPRLGWTSWLKTREFEAPHGEVRLSPRLIDFPASEE